MIRRLLVVAVVVAALLAPARTSAALPPSSWPDDAVPGTLLVTTTDDRAAAALAADHGGRAIGPTVQLRVPVGEEAVAASSLRERDGVVAVEPDRLRPLLRTPDDPLYSSQWAHQLAGAPAAWDTTTGSPTVQVAVIDTGVDGTHPGLSTNIVGQVDVSGGFVIDKGVGVNNDACNLGHGTMVAGILGAVGNDGRDVSGVAWRVGIVDMAATDPEHCGLFTDSAVLAGLQHAVNLGVDVVNLSLGGPGDACPTAVQLAVDSARQQGVVIVAAAGNEQELFPGLTSIPGSCNGVIAVGAVGQNGQPARYSNTNAWVDLAAPGGDTSSGQGVLSTFPGATTASEEGTSFAAPYVSGVAALLRSVNAGLSVTDVESILESTATRSGGTRTDALGWGIVNAGAAVAMAEAGGTIPAPASEPPFPVGIISRLSSGWFTFPITQAVAVSRALFLDNAAYHAIVARADDFADALAGSSLGFGAGPVLFTGSTGSLAPESAAELQRVLADGGVVYLLGGSAALPASLEGEIQALGLTPRRLAGPVREETAAIVADEVLRRLPELGFDAPRRVILATSFQWPDAVTGGSLGSLFGYPILLTPVDSLAPSTQGVLERMRPEQVYVVGGTAAINDAVAATAVAAAGSPPSVRLAGVDRNETAVAVAERVKLEVNERVGFDPLLAVAVNLRRGDGFTHVLSSSAMLGAYSGVFIPIEGDGGDVLPDAAVRLACAVDPVRGVVAGGTDMITDAVKDRLGLLLEHLAPECSG